MAEYVHEIMNAELFSVAADEESGTVLDHLLALGITAAPIVDDDGRPVGMVSMRDLVDRDRSSPVFDHMSAPARIIDLRATIGDAAREMARHGVHHLVVVDASGRSVGFASVLDVVRGLIGAPIEHPAPFPHLDPATGLSWTDEIELALDNVDRAPDGPGFYVLIHGIPGTPDRVVWSEASSNVRSRLLDILSMPQRTLPQLETWLAAGRLWFRSAATPSSRALRAAAG